MNDKIEQNKKDGLFFIYLGLFLIGISCILGFIVFKKKYEQLLELTMNLFLFSILTIITGIFIYF